MIDSILAVAIFVYMAISLLLLLFGVHASEFAFQAAGPYFLGSMVAALNLAHRIKASSAPHRVRSFAVLCTAIALLGISLFVVAVRLQLPRGSE